MCDCAIIHRYNLPLLMISRSMVHLDVEEESIKVNLKDVMMLMILSVIFFHKMKFVCVKVFLKFDNKLEILLLQQIPSSKSYTPTCGCTLYKNSKTTMFILFIPSVPVTTVQE